MQPRSVPGSTLVCLLVLLVYISVASGHPQVSQDQSSQLYVPLIRRAVAAQSNAITVKSYTSYIQGSDRYIIGEVVNTTNYTVYDVGVTPIIVDANHYEVSKITVGFIKRLEPNKTTPFKVVISGLAEPITKLSLPYSYNSSIYPDYGSAQVTVQSSNAYFGTTLAGVILNTNTKTLSEIVVAITFYDDTGKVVDAEMQLLRGIVLPPQAIVHFYIQTRPLQTEFRSYSIQAEGILRP
jgi:hypothetical protein